MPMACYWEPSSATTVSLGLGGVNAPFFVGRQSASNSSPRSDVADLARTESVWLRILRAGLMLRTEKLCVPEIRYTDRVLYGLCGALL